MDALLSRITVDPAICHGKPCVRGLRYPVELLLDLLSSGMSNDEILADYEELERDDLLAVQSYVANRAARADRAAYERALAKVPAGPPQPGDERP